MTTFLSLVFALWLLFIAVKLLSALFGFIRSRRKGTNP
jgi:hypothetical protein